MWTRTDSSRTYSAHEEYRLIRALLLPRKEVRNQNSDAIYIQINSASDFLISLFQVRAHSDFLWWIYVHHWNGWSSDGSCLYIHDILSLLWSIQGNGCHQWKAWLCLRSQHNVHGQSELHRMHPWFRQCPGGSLHSSRFSQSFEELHYYRRYLPEQQYDYQVQMHQILWLPWTGHSW